MTMGIAKANVEREMVQAWEALASTVDSFSEAELEVPGVVGDWSVKDIIGHIAFWAQQAPKNLQLIASGRPEDVQRPDNETALDEWNARERRERQDLPLSAIREEWLESFQKAMEALASFPAEKMEEKVKGQTAIELFAADTYEHYREHLAHLAEWRRELETTEA